MGWKTSPRDTSICFILAFSRIAPTTKEQCVKATPIRTMPRLVPLVVVGTTLPWVPRRTTDDGLLCCPSKRDGVTITSNALCLPELR